MNAYASSVGARSASCAHGPRAASHDSRYLTRTLVTFLCSLKKEIYLDLQTSLCFIF